MKQVHALRSALMAWYDREKRDLPWRRSRDPYRIWLSEIMAQQTRIAALLPYFVAFTRRFPTVEALAAADEAEVLKAWEGLGYYSRARSLHKAAQIVAGEMDGRLPSTAAALEQLPGIGPYTAAAIASIAFGEGVPAVDGNALRVVSRLCALQGDIALPAARVVVAEKLAAILPCDRPGDGNQAIMELGALVCLPKTPRCEFCPVEAFCAARIAGIERELPVKSAKKTPVVVRRAIALVEADGARLLRLRTEKLLHKLWEFPGVESPFEADDVALLTAMLADLGIEATPLNTPPIAATHVFTHRRWEMVGYRFSASQAALPEGYVWADLGEMAERALPSAMRAFVDARW